MSELGEHTEVSDVTISGATFDDYADALIRVVRARPQWATKAADHLDKTLVGLEGVVDFIDTRGLSPDTHLREVFPEVDGKLQLPSDIPEEAREIFSRRRPPVEQPDMDLMNDVLDALETNPRGLAQALEYGTSTIEIARRENRLSADAWRGIGGILKEAGLPEDSPIRLRTVDMEHYKRQERRRVAGETAVKNQEKRFPGSTT